MLIRSFALFFCVAFASGASLAQDRELPPLESLETLPLDLAKKYIDAGVMTWNLPGLSSISEGVLDLIGRNVNEVRLDGLKEVSNGQLEKMMPIYKLSLNGLTKLRPGQAKSLSGLHGKIGILSLDGVTELSQEDLLGFADGPFELSLRGITSLTLAQAKILARPNIVTRLDGLTEIPEDVFAELRKGETVLFLGGLRSLTDRQAILIANGKNGLSLNGVRSLSDHQLKILARGNMHTTLNGIDRLSPSQEQILLERPHQLHFHGLRQVSVRMAAQMASQEGFGVDFLYPLSFSAEAAQEFGKARSGFLSFPAQTQLSPEQARGLAKTCSNLNLDGLKEISPQVASELANHVGWLQLNGVTRIDPPVARDLGRHIGQLDLRGLTELSDESAQELSNHRGGIALGKLTRFSEYQAESLAQLRPLFAENSQLLPQALAFLPKNLWPRFDRQIPGSLCLNESSLILAGSPPLGDGQARALGGMRMPVEFENLTVLGDSQAQLLTRKRGDFIFHRLPELTDRQAEVFSEAKGRIQFYHLNYLTEKQAKILANFKGKLLVINGYFEGSPNLKSIFSDKNGVIYRNYLEKN